MIGSFVLAFSMLPSSPGETLLVRDPTRSAEALCFAYAGDLWIARPDGSDARRLTVLPTVESDPCFSPDGSRIAFTGQYDGNVDVYVIAVEGGDPVRLTYHPGADQVRGWTSDGQKVLFRSGRDSGMRHGRLWTVDLGGGHPEALPLPMAERGSFASDGRRLAYTPIADAFDTWKRYRGGMSGGIWIFDSWTHEIEKIPREGANDTLPVWMGETVYFLSDRSRTMNVFAYDTRTKALSQVTHHDDFDVRSLAAGGGVLVYEQGGRIHEIEPASGATKTLAISIAADLPARRPHYVEAKEWVRGIGISPTGKRALLEARGEILTVPAKKGSWRNLTRTNGVHERDATWSPDGKTVACLSDASGEYQLLLYPQDGLSEPRAIALGEAPSFYHGPEFSPDGKKILLTDKRLNVLLVDLESGSTVVVDTDTYDHPVRSLDPAWSPDGRWIAYTKRLDNHFRALVLYDVEHATAHQVTDGLSDATSACFSRDGKYLYFTASTDVGLNAAWLDMTSIDRPTTRSIYLAVLASDVPSPFLPESDEEGVAEESDEKEKEEVKEEKGAEEENLDDAPKPIEPIRVDVDGLDQRILALPLPPGHYGDLRAADESALLYLDTPAREGASSTLHRFDMVEKKTEPLLGGIQAYALSADGKKVVYAAEDETVGIVDAKGKHSVGDGKVDLGPIQIQVDPLAEWRQIFREAWRIERDYFYDEAMHGLDWTATRARYEPFLAHVAHRSDLNYLLAEMIGEMVVGHNYVGGGDEPDAPAVSGGLLGADFAVDAGRYRIARILTGENWNPELRAPLTGPGIDARVGDYVLSIDGKPLAAPEDIQRRLEGTAGRSVVLTLNERPDMEGARTVTVVPVPSEAALRHRAWIEANRKRVAELSGGRVAYVYLPDTAGGGYSYFTRYFFSQLSCDAVVIDERFNGGGLVADYIVDLLDRPLLSWWATREGKPFQTPLGSILGPKVMLINEYAGSGGDALPHFFRRRGIGKLVGKRTWGGLVGIYDYPTLIDGGYLMSPRLAIYSPDGEWEVENEGVPPDVEVDLLPKDWIAGHDRQLETAVEIVLAELAQHPISRAARPAPPQRAR